MAQTYRCQTCFQLRPGPVVADERCRCGGALRPLPLGAVKAVHPSDARDQAEALGADRFVISRFEGRGAYTRREASSLDQAREIAAEMGPARYGQRPMIFAIVRRDVSILVTEA